MLGSASALRFAELDPRWTLRIDHVDPTRRNLEDTLLSLVNGRLGWRANSNPQVFVNGAYDHALDGAEALLPAPAPNLAFLDPPVASCLDLRRGILHRTWDADAVMRTTEVALCDQLALVRRIEVPASASGALLGPALQVTPERPVSSGRTDEIAWSATSATGARGGIVGALTTRSRTVGSSLIADTFVAYAHDPRLPPDPRAAIEACRALAHAGFDDLVAEHRVRWMERWRDATVTIDGDPEVELGVRFALFHLLGCSARDGESAVGARGLTGPSYRGHVFWDADVFVLPALAATLPSSARAMLEYRVRRLPAARTEALRRGRAGARFPWESASEGTDVTPPLAWLGEQPVPIRTAECEEHIVADVAWAAWQYSQWTGDVEFLSGPGRSLITEGARYWLTRARLDHSGLAHLFGVIGPDEYHEPVDDNAYTNVMARWNLRIAAMLVRRDGIGGNEAEAAAWSDLADRLVDGFDPVTQRYEQFAGFDLLEPLAISDVAQPPVAADLLLGRERVADAQVVKQADVLMFHHLVPDETAPDSLRPNLDYYGPRTAHGSSLSPAIHASLLARLGRVDEARSLFAVAARLDLDDLTGMAAGGLHLATMGGVWQAVAMGFAGVRPHEGRLDIDPKLPNRWEMLELRCRFRNRHLGIRCTHDTIEIDTDEIVGVDIKGGQYKVSPPGAGFTRVAGHWDRKDAA